MRVDLANELVNLMYDLCLLSWETGTSFYIENPRSSLLWAMPQMKLLASLPGVQKVRVDCCQFGAPWKKPTTVLFFGNTFFKQNESVCPSHGKDDFCNMLGVPHVSLTGHDGNIGNNKHAFRISLAEPYPQELCSKWAQLITVDYNRRTRGPPYPAQHHGHKIKGSDLDINIV